MTDTRSLESLIAHALAYRWAGRLFAYPDANLLDTLSSKRAWQEVTEAVANLDDAESVANALTTLRLAWLDCISDGQSLATEYTRLFAREVPCPPYESSYGVQQTFSRVQALSELAGLYAVFGFKIAEAHRDLHDHIGVELEFLSLLYSKEAVALERGWTARARLCHKARMAFCEEHLGWISNLTQKLQQHASLAFYPASAAWAQALLDLEAAHEYRGPAVASR